MPGKISLLQCSTYLIAWLATSIQWVGREEGTRIYAHVCGEYITGIRPFPAIGKPVSLRGAGEANRLAWGSWRASVVLNC